MTASIRERPFHQSPVVPTTDAPPLWRQGWQRKSEKLRASSPPTYDVPLSLHEVRQPQSKLVNGSVSSPKEPAFIFNPSDQHRTSIAAHGCGALIAHRLASPRRPLLTASPVKERFREMRRSDRPSENWILSAARFVGTRSVLPALSERDSRPRHPVLSDAACFVCSGESRWTMWVLHCGHTAIKPGELYPSLFVPKKFWYLFLATCWGGVALWSLRSPTCAAFIACCADRESTQRPTPRRPDCQGPAHNRRLSTLTWMELRPESASPLQINVTSTQ